jgi:hypothetical protein
MRTRIAVISIFLALCGVMFAAEPSLQQLKTQVATANPKDQPKLYVKIAEIELKNVEALYNGGDIGKAPTAVAELATDCESAAQAAKTTRKHMKRTEIALRKIGSHLEALGRSVAFDDRPPIKQAGDRIEKARSALLDAMFSK